MKRDAIDFESNDIGKLFRKMLVPTLLGTLSMSAMTAIDGIIVGHGVGAVGVAAVNIVVPIYTLMSGIALMVGAGCSVPSSGVGSGSSLGPQATIAIDITAAHTNPNIATFFILFPILIGVLHQHRVVVLHIAGNLLAQPLGFNEVLLLR